MPPIQSGEERPANENQSIEMTVLTFFMLSYTSPPVKKGLHLSHRIFQLSEPDDAVAVRALHQ